MQLTRRHFLSQMGWLTAATAAHGAHVMQHAGAPPQLLDTRALAHFVDPLPIPSIVKPAGTKPSPANPSSQIPYYRIVMRELQAKVHRDVPPTTFWGYNASCPGPIIEARHGEPILVEWVNQLPSRHLFAIDHTLHGAETDKPEVRTVVHLHGGRTGPESDGYPTDWFTTGQSATCFYPNQQDAATLFYHDHAMGITRLNAVAGLMGLYILRDSFEDALKLPSDAYELPLILFDRSFHPDGCLFYPISAKPEAPWVSEYYGSAILVNGKVFPFHEVEPRSYRLRFLNSSNGSFYKLCFSPEANFTAETLPVHLIASEQGFLSAPIETKLLVLGPGERADIVLDFTAHAGKEVILRTDVAIIMQFRVSGAIAASHKSALAPLSATLRPVMRIPESDVVRTRELTLADYQNRLGRSSVMLLNASHWDMPVTENPVLNSTEIWSFINLTDDSHPIHLHMVRFQVLDRRPLDVTVYQLTGKIVFTAPAVTLEPSELGWKDLARVDPFTVTRIIVKFEGYAGRYVWHCHMLEHEDNEMMRPYVVTPD
jgi:spore coat protein A, manganese oxidase